MGRRFERAAWGEKELKQQFAFVSFCDNNNNLS